MKQPQTEKTRKESAREIAATAVLELNKADQVALDLLYEEKKQANADWDAASARVKAINEKIAPLEEAIAERSLVAERVGAVNINPPREVKESTSCVL